MALTDWRTSSPPRRCFRRSTARPAAWSSAATPSRSWPATPPTRTAARLLLDGFFDDLPADLAPALGAARAEVFAHVAALDDGAAGADADGGDARADRPARRRRRPGDRAAPDRRAGRVHRRGGAPPGRARRRWRPTRRCRTPPTSCACCAAQPAPPAEVKAFETYLVTVIDHGLNASTFTARVVASTQAGLASAVLGGISALKGPLHGGAPGPVIEMLDGIGTPENARAWIEQALDRGDRLMGFGHRVYRVRDPRADALKRAVRMLGRALQRAARPPGLRRGGGGGGAGDPEGPQAEPLAADQRRVLHRAAAGGAGLPARRPSPACSPSAASPAGSPTPANRSPAAA